MQSVAMHVQMRLHFAENGCGNLWRKITKVVSTAPEMALTSVTQREDVGFSPALKRAKPFYAAQKGL